MPLNGKDSEAGEGRRWRGVYTFPALSPLGGKFRKVLKAGDLGDGRQDEEEGCLNLVPPRALIGHTH